MEVSLFNGEKMPLVGLGMWQITDETDVERSIDAALEAGYRSFDTATLYGNEKEMGKVFKKWLDSGKIERKDLFITTKLPWNAMAAERVETFLNSSLKRLQMDYVDLYLSHFPIGVMYTTEDELTPLDKDGSVRYDPTTNLEAIWAAMEEQVESGKAKSIGLSNFNEKQIERILSVAKIHPANLQIEAHAYFQNLSLRQFALSKNMSVSAYCVLGSCGRIENPNALVGWKFEYIPTVLEDKSVKVIAGKHGKTPAQILLRFLVQQNTAVLPKSSNPARIKENIDIFDFRLDESDMKALEALEKGESFRSFCGFSDIEKHPECPWNVERTNN